MDFLMQALRVTDFEQVLSAYASAGIDLGDAIDGGAGFGGTARSMIELLGPDAQVYAFEPFPGNHRFFDDADPRIHLVAKALASTPGHRRFAVPSVVSSDSTWREGMEGYSSAGHLSETDDASPHDVTVECARADDEVPAGRRIGFVKLDLQGGELDALRGMTRLLRHDVAVAWIEYGPAFSPPELLDLLRDEGFLLYDTKYLFRGDPNDLTRSLFDVEKEGHRISSGSTMWFGFKRTPWTNFDDQLTEYARDLRLIQTNLCCVSRRHLREFTAAARHLT